MNTPSWQRRLVAKCERDAFVAPRTSRGFWFTATIQATRASHSPSCDVGVAATFVE
jgi:hypothetical protein